MGHSNKNNTKSAKTSTVSDKEIKKMDLLILIN